MGSGSWDSRSFVSYSAASGRAINTDGVLDTDVSAQSMFKQRGLAEELNPRLVARECRDSEEHPNTIPVILALDVTGSMGHTAVQVAAKLNKIMTELYEKVSDVQFMIMGIGDFAYDQVPLQVSQFESDIRIAEQLDKIYFEGGGGGNNFESYTAAWYFADRHTELDCWKRGKKGIIITMGDERLNPYIPSRELSMCVGDNLQADIDTKELYSSVKEKYDVYHLSVEHDCINQERANRLANTFASVIGSNNVETVDVEHVSDAIVEIVLSHVDGEQKVSDTTVVNNEPLSF